MSKDSSLLGFHRINNKANKSSFDLGRRNLFTAKIGELLPVFCEEVMPGDSVKIDMQHFSRTMPVQSAAFTRLRENVQFFFVPWTSVWTYARRAFQRMDTMSNGLNASKVASTPYGAKPLTTLLPYFKKFELIHYLHSICKPYDFNIKSELSIDSANMLRGSQSAKLLQMLGYGNFTPIVCGQRSDETSPVSSDNIISFNGEGLTFPDDFTTNPLFKTAISPLRLLAYHKVANEFYRNKQWQSYRPYSCNVDYVNPDNPSLFGTSPTNDATLVSMSRKLAELPFNLFDMEYSNLPTDYFNGAIPRQQFGDESVVSLRSSGSANVLTGTTNEYVIPKVGFSSDGQASLSVSLPKLDDNNANLLKVAPDGTIGAHGLSNDKANILLNSTKTIFVPSYLQRVSVPTGDSSLSIIELRRATAIQRYKEIQNCHDADFVEQVQAHFGIKPNDNGSSPLFLGGYSSTFDINPQINQNLNGENVAEIKAAPTSNGNGKCKFTAKDYGVIIGIYRVTPQLDFAGVGIDSRTFLVDSQDYPIPELDSIGMEQSHFSDLIDTPTGGISDIGLFNRDVLQTPLGYVPRYLPWKLSKDTFTGAYLNTLKTWVTGYSTKDLLELLQDVHDISDLNERSSVIIPQLLRCYPSLVKDVFVNNKYDGADNDQFMVGSYINCIINRRLSRYGLPYSD